MNEQSESQLSLITNHKGGIIDDTVITRLDKSIGMVINGACKHKDLQHMHQVLAESGMDANIEHLDHRALFALQGPKAAEVVSQLIEGVDISSMIFMNQRSARIAGIDCNITRCGYTGEDGFEISVENSDASHLMQALLGIAEVKPAGLGARDTLRVEAGLCLYGSDIDEDTSPISAGLTWTIGKRRRAEGNFIGSDIILEELNTKSTNTKRVGLLVSGPPARSHTKLFAAVEGGSPIGEITSGTFSPVLGKPIAMGMVNKEHSKVGKIIFAQIRKNRFPAEISKMPFIPSNYYRGSR